MNTIIIKEKKDDENGIAIEFFQNNNGVFGVRIYDTDVNENYDCILFPCREMAEKYYDYHSKE